MIGQTGMLDAFFEPLDGDFPDEPYQALETVPQLGTDRKSDDAIWVREAAWVTRCMRDRTKLQSGARRRLFGKRRGAPQAAR